MKHFLSLSLKATLEILFSCSYYEIWRKPFTEDFILGLQIFAIIFILKFFFRIWGFRGIGNIFFGGWVLFWGIGGWRENRTDIHPISFRLLIGRGQRKQFYRRIRRPMKLFYFLVWSSENGIKEKRRGLLQNFVDNVWVFQSRWCFGFVWDLEKWNVSGKGVVPICW